VSSAVSVRLVRLLNMVPYFQANPRITYTEAAADLGVSVKQLRDDLNQLWMCGLPGYGPGDLIDFEFSGDTIEVTFSAGIDHPLRLTSPEATGVLVALRALVDVPGMVDPEAARSAIAKIESAAGTVSLGAEAAVDDPAPVESPAAAAVRAATNGRGADVIYDGLGRAAMAENLDALALCGHWVSYGQASGPLPPVDPKALAARSLTLSCPVLFHYTAERAALNEIAQQTFEALRTRILRVEVRHRYPLASAAEAHRDLESRRTTGPLVLLP